MEFSLHNMRMLARRFGVVMVTVYLWSTLMMMAPATAQAAMPMHDHTMNQQMMGHATDHLSHPQSMNHHGSSACCLTGQHCTSSCLISLPMVNGTHVAVSASIAPLPHLPAQALTRPPQPPRRPPKA